MSNIFSATPHLILEGTKDISRRTPAREPEQTPTHLPHVFLFAETGPEQPTLVGSSASVVFGQKTFDPRSEYYNHQTELVGEILGEGNQVFIQRMIPADAGPKPRVLYSLDIVADAVQQYERNDDGSFRLNQAGNKIPVAGTGATIQGHRARWVLNDWEVGGAVEPFGEVSAKAGGLVAADQTQSQILPILEFEHNFFGAKGNNSGIRLIAPTLASNQPMNSAMYNSTKTHIYRLAVVSRQDASSTVNVEETLSGVQTIDFSLKPGAIDTVSDSELYLEDIFTNNYQDLDTPGTVAKYGPFGRVKIYTQNLEAVLAMIGETEAPLGTLPVSEIDADSEYLYAVNPFSALSADGVPYYSFELGGVAEGGIRLSENTAQWAEGGSDGTMTFQSFDELVRNEMLNYGSTGTDILDLARYPVSDYYDSGFTLDTKLAFFTPLAHRKDVFINVCTQDVSQPMNTPAMDTSIAQSLRNAARLYPESEIYGTGACRVSVHPHAGIRLGSKYRGVNGRKHLPFIHGFAKKAARYMGAGNRIWNRAAAFDESPNNQIEGYRDHNVKFLPYSARRADWAAGMISAQSFDMRSMYYPGIQTVYDDDTSVLNSYFNARIITDLEKVAQRAYRRLAGISGRLTKAQFAARSDEMIMADVEGCYDGRAQISCQTYYTKADQDRGYSWRTVITMRGQNMSTVGVYTIEAARSEEIVTAD